MRLAGHIVLALLAITAVSAPAFTEVKAITLNQKRDHNLELGGAQKIGFKMSYEEKTGG